MRKLLTFLIAAAVTVGASLTAFAQSPINAFPPSIFQNRAAIDAPVNNLAFDASTTVFNGTAASGSVTLTTTQTNDIIIVCSQNNGANVTSVSDTAGLTWTQVGVRTGTSWVYWAKATSTLSSDSITVTLNSGTFLTVQAAAFSGANTTTPFDSNGALPGTTTTATPLTLTTTNANDLLFSCYALNGGATAD